MAKVTDQTAIPDVASGDVLHIVDVSDTTDDPAGSSFKVTVDNLTAYYDSATATLTNKTLDLGNNTVTGTTAEFNTALSDGSFATLAGSETLTNKTINTANNTITVVEADISDLGSYITAVVDDTSPQLGGQLDVNGNAIGDGTLELLAFSETASAVNHVQIANAATGNAPAISAVGDDTNVGLTLSAKGTGDITVGNFVFDADQTVGAGQDNYVLTYDNGTGLISLEASAGGGGTPGGSDDDLQFNDGGSFAGSSLKQLDANTVEARNSTNAQTFTIYNTYTDASNYERGFMRWESNALKIGAEAAGTGVESNTEVHLQTEDRFLFYAGSAFATICAVLDASSFRPASSAGSLGQSSDPWSEFYLSDFMQLTSGTTVAGLPTATLGRIARVTDADTPSVGSTVTGGSTSAALVWYNGSNWTVIGV